MVNEVKCLRNVIASIFLFCFIVKLRKISLCLKGVSWLFRDSIWNVERWYLSVSFFMFIFMGVFIFDMLIFKVAFIVIVFRLYVVDLGVFSKGD